MSDSMITPPATPLSVSPPNRSFNITPKPSFSTQSTSLKENVQVMIRCRPRSEKEIAREKNPCWDLQAEVGSIKLFKPKTNASNQETFYFGMRQIYLMLSN